MPRPIAVISRFVRMIGSLAILVIAYRAYAWIAVPLIEPSARVRQRATSTAADRERIRHARSHERKQLELWFPPGSWELEAKLVIELPQGKLLINQYQTLPDGRLKLHPCTIVFLPDSKGDEQQRLREAVILQVPGGAELKFDEPLDPRKFKIGNVESGVLPGPLTIRSDYKQPGPADDLLIVARDAELKDNRVVSPHPIKFHFGPNQGSGRDVEIDLGKGTIGAKPQDGGLRLEGIKSLTIKREVIVFLDAGKGSLLGGLHQPGLPTAAPAAPAPPVQAIPKPPPPLPHQPAPPDELALRITCQGPFRFNMAGYEASFEDRVDVLRLNEGGQSDRLQCQRLSMFFAPQTRPGEQPDHAHQPGSAGRLRPARIEARGQPVTIESPAEDVEAVGEILRYDLQTRAASLEGEQPVMIRSGRNRITAPRVEYRPETGRRFGKFSATGPGRITGLVPDDPPREFAASWKSQLIFAPDGTSQVFSLRGGAQVEMLGFGSLGAEEIHVWLEERPQGMAGPAPHQAARPTNGGLRLDQQPYFPQRMLATGDVRLDAVQLTGRVGQLQIWFKPAPPQISTLADGRALEELPPPPGAPRRARAPQLAAGLNARQRFRVEGNLLQAEVLVDPTSRPQLGKLRVHQRAEVVETQTDSPGQRPFAIRGHDIDYEQTDPARGVLLVSGTPEAGNPGKITPAHIEGRGLTLDGPTIRLDRGRNRLTIDGPGAMTVPADQDLQGRPIASPRPLSVAWQRGLDFDGLAAQFAGSVICEFDNHQLRTEQLDVTFTQRVDFARPPDEKRPEVATVACHGSAVLSGRTFTAGELTSVEQMQAFDLSFDRLSGAIHAAGPGAMTMVRKGELPVGGQDPPRQAAGDAGPIDRQPTDPRVQPASTASPARDNGSEDLPPPPAPQSAAQNGYTYVHVEFPREMRGSMPTISGDSRPSVVEFSDRVKTTYGPVSNWEGSIDADAIDQQLVAGEAEARNVIFMTSRYLTITQLPDSAAGPQSVELGASGNVEIQGINFADQTFFARADRLSYAAAKDLMILQGDGRAPAEFSRQNPYWTGSGGKIFYWPKTKRFKVEGAQGGDIALPAGS